MSSLVRFSYSVAAGLLLAVSAHASDKAVAPYRWEERPIAAGYTLVRELRNGEVTFFICGSQEEICKSAPTIGWDRPFIVTRNEGSEPGWDTIDTSSRKETYVLESTGLPPRLANIPLRPAMMLWQKLGRRKKPLW
jgi:hypothetical protein